MLYEVITYFSLLCRLTLPLQGDLVAQDLDFPVITSYSIHYTKLYEVVVFLSQVFRKSIRRRFHLQWVKSDKMNSSLQDVISGMRVVKSFGKEISESEKFNLNANEYAKVQKRNEIFWASFYPMLTFLMSLGISYNFV